MKSEILIYPPLYLIESINFREFYQVFFYPLFKLEHNRFTTLRQFLLHNKVNQLHVHIYPLPHELPSHSPHLTSRSSQRTRMSSLHKIAVSPQLSISHMVMYIHPRDSLNPSCSPSPPLSTRLFSTFVSQFLPYTPTKLQFKNKQTKKRLKLQGRNRGVCCFVSFIFFLLMQHS